MLHTFRVPFIRIYEFPFRNCVVKISKTFEFSIYVKDGKNSIILQIFFFISKTYYVEYILKLIYTLYSRKIFDVSQ